jgi:arylsulfatase A-like enzyme
MRQDVNRRAFLKLMTTLSGSAMLGPVVSSPSMPNRDPNAPNILVVLFDAFSGSNVPFMGYERQSMPLTSKLVERATVFHNHYAGGPFTTPGTSTLLTGTYPWTNRAFISNSEVLPELRKHNMFHLFDDHGYHQIAYSHNAYVVTLLRQFRDAIDHYIPRQDLYLGSDFLFSRLLINDWDVSIIANDQALDYADRVTNSVLMSRLITPYMERRAKAVLAEYADLYPRGLPRIRYNNFYIIEDAIDAMQDRLPVMPQPFLGYFHLLPPHGPYTTRREFIDIFKDDGFVPLEKPRHPAFSQGYRQAELNDLRRDYDEYVALVDSEFARLFRSLEASGLLENTWLVVTSDHGEMFERGIARHMTQALFEPVMRIPLVVFEPGQRSRRDVYERTGAADILPTLMKWSGITAPDWVEGQVLPPYRDTEVEEGRNIYALMGHRNPGNQRARLRVASTMLIKEGYKLTYYFGYPELGGEELYELYDLDEDPQELNNLYSPENATSKELVEELKQAIARADEPYS